MAAPEDQADRVLGGVVDDRDVAGEPDARVSRLRGYSLACEAPLAAPTAEPLVYKIQHLMVICKPPVPAGENI